MKLPLLVLSMAFCGTAFAQGPRPTDLGAVDLPVGEQSVAWYTTWETAAAEAKRSNRPIFFFAAAAQCRTVSGTF